MFANAALMKMVVDPTKIGEHKMFRAKGWEIAIVVNEEIKCALEDAGHSGAAFCSLESASTTEHQ